MIYIYTDGACSGNEKESAAGGFGVVVYEDDKILEVYGEHHDGTTNNRMEMQAILWALQKYGKNNFLIPTVYSDSAYAINTFTSWKNSWKEKGWTKSDGKIPENLDLVQLYDNLENQGHDINLVKVKGHTNVKGNILADYIAVKFAKLQ